MEIKHPIGKLRQTLRETIEEELTRLPELLTDLTPKERIVVICKLLPYVMAKQETVQIAVGWDTETV